MIVVDASVAGPLATAEDGFAALAAHEPCAPALMWSEASSYLRRLAWSGLLDPREARAGIETLAAAPIGREGGPASHAEAYDLAASLGWARTYDAEYVALARRFRCPLLTGDTRLRRDAGHIVEMLGPADL